MHTARKKLVPPEGKGAKRKTGKTIRLATFNVRSIINKTTQVLEHLNDEDCDICLVQETFLKEAEKAKLQQIRDYGWNILSNPRKHRSGGGIAVLYRKELILKSNDKVLKPKTFQVMEVILKTTSCLIRLVNIYRPGYGQKARHTRSSSWRNLTST